MSPKLIITFKFRNWIKIYRNSLIAKTEVLLSGNRNRFQCIRFCLNIWVIHLFTRLSLRSSLTTNIVQQPEQWISQRWSIVAEFNLCSKWFQLIHKFDADFKRDSKVFFSVCCVFCCIMVTCFAIYPWIISCVKMLIQGKLHLNWQFWLVFTNRLLESCCISSIILKWVSVPCFSSGNDKLEPYVACKLGSCMTGQARVMCDCTS